MPEGKQIRISNRLYEHLKSIGGVMSKNLDELVFGKPDNNPLTQDKLDEMLKQATVPDSAMLYSAIILSFFDSKDADWKDFNIRGGIVMGVRMQFEKLPDYETRKMFMKEFWLNMNDYRGLFQTTIDNRINNLVRAGVLRREEAREKNMKLYYFTQKPNLEFIQNVWNYYAQTQFPIPIKTRRFVQMIFSEDDGSNDSLPI